MTGAAVQEALWDDSALVDSWNDALAEYKKYHSLAAQGKKVDRESLELELAKLQGAEIQVEEFAGEEYVDAATSGAQAETTDADATMEEPKVQIGTGQVNGNAVPQALMGGVQDEGLKNLMMSWYYAGYYTGLHEGQQKAYASMQQPDG